MQPKVNESDMHRQRAREDPASFFRLLLPMRDGLRYTMGEKTGEVTR